MSSKHWLFILQGAPYFDPLTAPAIDAAMAAGVFGQQVSVLFTGNAQLQLSDKQIAPTGMRNIGKSLSSLILYDVEALYVDARLWPAGSDLNPNLNLQRLDAQAMTNLLASVDHVMSF